MLPDGQLRVELNQRQNGRPVVSVKALLEALGFDDNRIRRTRVTRERLVLRPRRNLGPTDEVTAASLAGEST